MIVQNVKVSDAAQLIGKSQQFVRVGLQQNILPFGKAVQLSSVWTYHISPKLLAEYVGVTENEVKHNDGNTLQTSHD